MTNRPASPDAPGPESPPVVVGLGVHVPSPSDEQPSYLGFTSHEPRSRNELEQIRARGPELAAQLRTTPGFLGAVLFIAGDRMFTFSAWSDEDGPRATVERPGPHRAAIDEIRRHDVTAGGAHSLWKAHTMQLLTRCPACGTVTDSLLTHHHCPRCGTALPTHGRYL
jgi:ribosomal protein L32